MRAVKHRCVHYGALTGEDSAEREVKKGRKVLSGEGESAPVSGCQIPAGMLTCQLSWLRCPAGTIVGLCVLAVLPLADYCNAIIGVQMGL